MKKFFAVIMCLMLGVNGMQAQKMTDEQLIEFVAEAREKGDSDQDIAKQLLKKGVTMEQVNRIKYKYAQQQRTGQGMTMTEDGTVLLSQSYGRKNDSTVYLCTPDLAQPDTTVSLNGTAVDAWILDSLVTQSELVAMPMTEALCVGPEGEVLVLFESGAMAYSDGTNRTDHIWRFQ